MDEQSNSIENQIRELEKKNKQLVEENKQFEKAKEQDFKYYKTEIANKEADIKRSQNYNHVLEVKLKEKDQEVKLSDLKIKELQKQIPHFRIRAIRPQEVKRFSVD